MKKILFLLFIISTFSLSQWTPKRDTTLILALGDSHTEGSGTMGYRDHLIHYMDSLSYKVKMLGNRKTNFVNPNPAYGYTVNQNALFHQGINGISANTYRPLIPDTMNINLHGRYRNIPHIAILWLGANDIANGSYSTTTINNNISGTIDSIHSVDPLVRVLLINLTHFFRTAASQARTDSVNSVNTKLITTVANKVADGKYVKLIDMGVVATDSNYTQSDGIHFTTVANHNVIAPTILPYLRQAIDTVLPVGSVYSTYYNDWCMGTDGQWGLSSAWYLSTKTYGSYLGKVTHVIMFHTRDNVDSSRVPYFNITNEWVANGGSTDDSLNYFYNGFANPGAGYAAWVSRGTIFDLRDSLHAHGRKLLLEMQAVGATAGANTILADSSKTEVFTTAVADFVYRHGFDGVDFNAESGITFTADHVRRFYRILRDKLPNKVLTVAPVVTQTSLYANAKNYIDYVMPQHYAYALNDQPPNGNAVFLNSPMHLTGIPTNSNHQSLVDVNPYYSYTQPWSVIDWYSKGWAKSQLLMLLSTEANPFRGVDTMFSWKSGGKPFWADTIAHLMKSHGGTWTWDATRVGGYIHGTSDSTITYRGTSINADSLFYIPILDTRALDSITTYFVANGYKNFGLFDISTDARTPATVKTPLHDHLGSLLTIGEDSSIAVTSGNNQTGLINSALGSSCIVTVTDNYGYTVPNVSVTFSVYSVPSGATGYSLSTTTTTTNSSGQASTVLTLGNKTGNYVVRATANLTESPLSFTANATIPGRRSPFRR